MIRNYSLDQAAERLRLDIAELRFLVHHFWEFLPKTSNDNEPRQLSGSDLVMLERIVQMRAQDEMDIAAVRQQLRQEATHPGLSGRRSAEVLAFCSGRPGAGISTVVWELAAILAARGFRCTIVDGGLDRDSLVSMSEGQDSGNWVHILDSGIRLVSVFKTLTALDSPEEDTAEIWRELHLLDHASDFILVDTGPGCSDNALRYAMLVDETIMITTADVGMNADCFSVVRMLRDVDPGLPLSLLINRAHSLGEAREAFARINGAGRKLGLSDVPGLGWIIEDEAIKGCIASGESVVDTLPGSPVAKCLTLVSELLTNRLKPADRQNPGGLQELIRSLAANYQRTAVVRGL